MKGMVKIMHRINDNARYTRYSYSISPTSLHCVDMISGKGVAVKDGVVNLNDLDVTEVVEHLNTISAFISSTPIIDKVIHFPKTTENLTITELNSTDYEMTYKNGSATFIDGIFSASRKFKIKEVQKLIYSAFDCIQLLQDKRYGTGEYMIVDRVHDMIIFKNDEMGFKGFCSYGRNTTGNVLIGCIVNNIPYPCVVMYPDKIANKVIFETNTGEYLGEIPYTAGVTKACEQLPGFIPHMDALTEKREYWRKNE